MEEIDRAMAWIDQSPAHRAAFDHVEQAWHGPQHGASSNVVPFPQDAIQTSRSRRGWRYGVIAASLLAAAILPLLLWQQLPVKERYATRIGEHRTVRLQDGSVVEIGGGTRLSVEFRRDGRFLGLTEGEAMFTVAKDSRRPFMVYSAGGVIKAVGTAFNVNRGNDGVTVGVMEGVVQVRMDTPHSESVLLQRGSEESYSTVTGLGPVRQVHPDRIGSWRTGSFSFIDRSLGSVVSDLNRYAAKPIYIDHEALKQVHVTGTVTPDGILEWVQALHQTLPIQIIASGQAIHLRAAPASRRSRGKAVAEHS